MTSEVVPDTRAPLALIAAVSAVACGFLFWLLYFRDVEPQSSWTFLPALNAVMNACASACLIAGWRAIRLNQPKMHRTFMLSAFAFSSLFLIGYIAHHTLHGDTKFQGEGLIKIAYLIILASHVVLSIAALPMVLSTFYFSLTNQFARHRKLARWTLPIWLYVSVTGVVVFMLLKTFGAS